MDAYETGFAKMPHRKEKHGRVRRKRVEWHPLYDRCKQGSLSLFTITIAARDLVKDGTSRTFMQNAYYSSNSVAICLSSIIRSSRTATCTCCFLQNPMLKRIGLSLFSVL